MAKYVLKRILMIIPVILGVAVLIFTIMYFTPGDAARVVLPPNASQAQIDAIKDSFGLNDSYVVQLLRFLKEIFINFNLGISYINKTSVSSDILSRLPRTVLLAGMCMALQVVISLPLGVTAAVHQNKWQDYLCTVLVMVGQAVPGFWLALMMILLFSNKLHWLPSFGIGTFKHWIMPFITASIGGISVVARQMRSQMLEVIRSDYVVTARAKGVSERRIRYRHTLPNALIPVITGMGTAFGTSLGGAVVIETAFSIPGVGKYMVDGIANRDLPVIRGGVVVLAILFCLVILIIDLLYAFIDPRIKAQYEGQQKERVRKHA
jgi:peptide/nickel transport system permease protein